MWSYPDPISGREDIAGYLAFYFDKLDTWYEEDDEVFVHPRSPYHRVDVLNSSRHVRIEVDGETIADTSRPRLLFETGLPMRCYIPRADVRMELLEPSDNHTQCPYKGVASYFSVRVGDRLHEDLVWTYPFPIPECPKIEGLLAFWDERVDVFVDGELQPRPESPWARRRSDELAARPLGCGSGAALGANRPGDPFEQGGDRPAGAIGPVEDGREVQRRRQLDHVRPARRDHAGARSTGSDASTQSGRSMPSAAASTWPWPAVSHRRAAVLTARPM